MYPYILISLRHDICGKSLKNVVGDLNGKENKIYFHYLLKTKQKNKIYYYFNKLNIKGHHDISLCLGFYIVFL